MPSIEHLWRKRNILSLALLPAAALFAAAAGARRAAYRRRLLPARRLPVPVIVVGGITAGGGGKSPTVQALVAALKERRLAVGIIARGYGGSEAGPLLVDADSDPERCGDEALMHAVAAGVPVCIGADRPAAAGLLLENFRLDALISDDGLQHYRLGRDFEIACLSREALGNGWPLPAGPLREPASRLQQCDAIVRSDGRPQSEREHQLTLAAAGFADLAGGPLVAAGQIASMRTVAVAGTAHPRNFFASLAGLGIEPLASEGFADHHRFCPADLERLLAANPDAEAVLMTAKDAVKCARFRLPVPMYSLQLAPGLPDRLIDMVVECIENSRRRQDR